MTRKTTIVMLEDAGRIGGQARAVEEALRQVPGVVRAHVNPATEAAYVEYDGDRCGERDLETAVESAGVHPLHRERSRGSIPFLTPSQRVPMSNIRTSSRTWWAFAGFIAIAGFFLLTEHRAHLFGMLPFLFLLACPLLHMFGHGGHGGHGGQGDRDDEASDQRNRPASHHHHEDQGAPSVNDRPRDTW